MWTPIKTLLSAIIVCLIPNQITAQSYLTSNYTTHDGLPSNHITCLAQNQQGYLWIGSNKGVVKWGQDFMAYNTENGLPSNKITAILPLSNDALWIGTADKGLCLLTDNKVTSFNQSSGLINQNIRCLAFSQRKNLLFAGTANGIAIYNGKKINHFMAPSETWVVNCFLETDTAMLFATQNQGVYYYHFTKKNTFPLSSSSRLSEKKIHAWLITLSGDTLLSCRDKSLKVLSKSQMAIYNVDKTITQLGTNIKGQVYATATDAKNSSALYALENNTLKPISSQFVMPLQNVSSFLIDTQEDVLVLGTKGKGLVLWPGPMFDRFATSAKCGSLRDITLDDEGNIWVLGNNLFLTNNANHPFGQHTTVCDISKTIGTTKTNGPSKLCTTNQAVVVAHNNRLWAINRIAPEKNKPLGIQFDTICYFVIHDDLLVVKDKRTIKFYDWRTFELQKQELLDAEIQYSTKTSGYIWLLDNNKKMWCFDIGRNVFDKAISAFPTMSSNINKITTNKQGQLIMVDDIETIWLADFSYNPSSPSLKKINNPVAVGNTVSWILCDTKNRLWLGTDIGLSMIDINAFSAKGETASSNWGKGEGYASTESFKAIEGHDGNLWVLSEDRIIRFNPQTICKIHRQPALKISNISVSGNGKHQSLHNQFDIANTPTFGTKNNSLVFSFNITNLMNRDMVRYQYRLMPGNTEWSEPTKQSFVLLSNLQPGAYKLYVKAWFKHMPQNTSEMSLGFAIRQPWYLTVYAYVIYAVLIILLLVGLFELRLRQLKKREAYKADTSEKIALLKMEALQAQMNPHFIFNALNTLQYNILENNTDYSIEFLGEFSKLIRTTLDNASQHFITLKDEIEYIENYMKVEQMRYSQKFYYSISLSTDIDTNLFFVPPMIIQPHIENAIKYAFDTSIGYIIISISKVHDRLICMVEDNGIGRKKSLMKKKSHKSKGQTITSQRFEMLNKYYGKDNDYRYEIEDLHDEDGKPSGTRVTLYFPLITHEEALAANTKN